LTDNEINTLYEQNLLGISNAEALVTSTDKCVWGDVKLMAAADGMEYLEYSERKTRTGAEPRKAKSIRIIEQLM
jgi:hypothetical protein